MTEKNIINHIHEVRKQVDIFMQILKPLIRDKSFLSLDLSDIENNTLSDIRLVNKIIEESGNYSYILMLINSNNNKTAIISINTNSFSYNICDTEILGKLLPNTQDNIEHMCTEIMSI